MGRRGRIGFIASLVTRTYIHGKAGQSSRSYLLFFLSLSAEALKQSDTNRESSGFLSSCPNCLWLILQMDKAWLSPALHSSMKDLSPRRQQHRNTVSAWPSVTFVPGKQPFSRTVLRISPVILCITFIFNTWQRMIETNNELTPVKSVICVSTAWLIIFLRAINLYCGHIFLYNLENTHFSLCWMDPVHSPAAVNVHWAPTVYSSAAGKSQF